MMKLMKEGFDGVCRGVGGMALFLRSFFAAGKRKNSGYVLKLSLNELRLVSAAVLPCDNGNFRMIGVSADRVHLRNKIFDEMARASRDK